MAYKLSRSPRTLTPSPVAADASIDASAPAVGFTDTIEDWAVLGELPKVEQGW